MAPVSISSLLILVAIGSAAGAVLDPPQESPALVLALEETKGRLERESSLSACFERGYSAIAHAGCSSLDEVGKRRLALHFTSCHLEFAGRPSPPPCTDAALTNCLAALSGEQFSAYTSYTLHTDHLCFYLESRVWQKGTNTVIRNLLTGANDTAKALAHVVHASEDLRLAQEAALNRSSVTSMALAETQQLLLSSHEKLKASMDESWHRYELVAVALKKLGEYSALLLQLQAYLLANLQIFKSACYYLGCGVIAWALTSTKRTSDARFKVFVGFAAALAAEVLLAYRWTNINSALRAGLKPIALPSLLLANNDAAAADSNRTGSVEHSQEGVNASLARYARLSASTSAQLLLQAKDVVVFCLLYGIGLLGHAALAVTSGSAVITNETDFSIVSLEGLMRALAGGEGGSGQDQNSWDQETLRAGVRASLLLFVVLSIAASFFSFVDYQRYNAALLRRLGEEMEAVREGIAKANGTTGAAYTKAAHTDKSSPPPSPGPRGLLMKPSDEDPATRSSAPSRFSTGNAAKTPFPSSLSLVASSLMRPFKLGSGSSTGSNPPALLSSGGSHQSSSASSSAGVAAAGVGLQPASAVLFAPFGSVLANQALAAGLPVNPSLHVSPQTAALLGSHYGGYDEDDSEDSTYDPSSASEWTGSARSQDESLALAGAETDRSGEGVDNEGDNWLHKAATTAAGHDPSLSAPSSPSSTSSASRVSSIHRQEEEEEEGEGGAGGEGQGTKWNLRPRFSLGLPSAAGASSSSASATVLAPAPAAQHNPVLAFESPADFARLVSLSHAASAIHRFATVTAPNSNLMAIDGEADDEEDEEPEAAEDSDEDEDDDEGPTATRPAAAAGSSSSSSSSAALPLVPLSGKKRGRKEAEGAAVAAAAAASSLLSPAASSRGAAGRGKKSPLEVVKEDDEEELEPMDVAPAAASSAPASKRVRKH